MTKRIGAAITLIATLGVERWKVARAAAVMLMRELEQHRRRVSMALWCDQFPEATYELVIANPEWSKHGSAYVLGARFKESITVVDWYATMNVLGLRLQRSLNSDGQPVIVGPDRERMLMLLDPAIAAVRQTAMRRRLLRRPELPYGLALFDSSGPDAGNPSGTGDGATPGST